MGGRALTLIVRAEPGIIRYASGVIAFSTAFTRGLPHGILAAIHLPSASDELPANILHRLHKDERAFAETLSSRRRIEWAGGRLAARVAASALGTEIGALLTDDHGAPKAPKGLSISISHKADLALALVAKRKNGALGLDFEHLDRDRAHIAPKILRPDELVAVDALHEDRRWNGVLLRFAMKEAIYKALAPRHRRYIAFDEAEVSDFKDGEAKIQLFLAQGPSPRSIEGRYDWMPEGLVTSVRVHWD